MMLKISLPWLIIMIALQSFGQDIMVTGNVFDSSRKYIIPNVKIVSTSGALSFTDSSGKYNIMVRKDDSISFSYRNKSTTWFRVRDIKYPGAFDLALMVSLEDKYRLLREVIVVGKSYREDSLENRQRYAKIFNANTGQVGITAGNAMMGSSAGLDPNDIINLFNFHRNRSLKNFQQRLLQEEADKFIDYRFNKKVVKTISGFDGTLLDNFMIEWRPDYNFTASTSDFEFYNFILEASRLYSRGLVPDMIQPQQRRRR